MREQQAYTAGVYCRISSEDGANQESMSIGNQREMLCDYVKRQGWEVGGIYIDDGYSGVNFQRPDFQRMITDIEAGRLNMVVVKDLSRLGRNYILCGQYTEIYFPERNVRFIALNDGHDSLNTPTGMDITPFKHILNDMYAKDISTKIKSSLRTKALRGEFLGSLDPYGYLRDPEDKHKLIVNPETAPVVRRIFEMCAGGHGSRSIATILADEGILCPSDYTRWRKHDPEKDGVFQSSGFWRQTFIRSLLKNEMYLGNMVNGRMKSPSYRTKTCVKTEKDAWVIVPNTHEPIITRELFDEAHRAMERRKGLSSANSSYPTTRDDIFAGLFRCESCGTAMRLHMTGTGYYHYVCGRHHQVGKRACSSHYINRDKFNALVLGEIRKQSNLFTEDTERTARELAAKIGHEDEKKLARTKTELEKSRRQLTDLDAKLKRSYEDNMCGKLPDHIFAMLVNDYDGEKTSLKNSVREMEQRLEKACNARTDVDRFVKLIRKYAGFETLDSFMLHELVDRITIWETPNMGRYRIGKEKIITIYYKFVGALQ